jgi:hypothetical protein
MDSTITAWEMAKAEFEEYGTTKPQYDEKLDKVKARLNGLTLQETLEVLGDKNKAMEDKTLSKYGELLVLEDVLNDRDNKEEN